MKDSRAESPQWFRNKCNSRGNNANEKGKDRYMHYRTIRRTGQEATVIVLSKVPNLIVDETTKARSEVGFWPNVKLDLEYVVRS